MCFIEDIKHWDTTTDSGSLSAPNFECDDDNQIILKTEKTTNLPYTYLINVQRTLQHYFGRFYDGVVSLIGFDQPLWKCRISTTDNPSDGPDDISEVNFSFHTETEAQTYARHWVHKRFIMNPEVNYQIFIYKEDPYNPSFQLKKQTAMEVFSETGNGDYDEPFVMLFAE